MYFIIMIVDGSALSKSNGYCSSGMPDAPFAPGLLVGQGYGIDCFPGPFTGMVFSDVLTFLCFPALAGYYFYYHRRQCLNGKPTLPTDDESERQPLAPNAAPVPTSAKKNVYTASAIEDESLVCYSLPSFPCFCTVPVFFLTVFVPTDAGRDRRQPVRPSHWSCGP